MKRYEKGYSRKSPVAASNERQRQAWLAKNADRIEVFYLPSYSPERNPDELLSADLQQRATKIAPARTKIALTRTAVRSLRSMQKQPQRIENFFKIENIYAAA